MTDATTIGDLLAGRDWFRLQHDTETRSASVHVYGTIGSNEWWDDVASPSLVRELDQLDVDEITLYVNSPGGIADDGIAIMNALARNKANVVAHVDGLAASAATIVILGADEIVMGAGSRLMIHDAWSITWGQASVIQKTAERLDKLSQTLAGLYAERAGGDADEWRKAMVAETWYTAEEAVEAGLANRVAPLHASDDDESAGSDVKASRNVIPIADAARVFGWRHPGREAASAPFIPSRAAAGDGRKLPVSSEPGDPNRKEHVMTNGDLMAGLRERLGVTDADATDEQILAAADALKEKANAPAAARLPEGVVTIEAAQLTELRADAAAGREARNAQIAAERAATVDAAINDGRIAPARREHWIKSLEADEGSAETLAGLEKGLIPLEAAGHTGGVDEASDEDVKYTKIFPAAAKEA